MKELGLVLMGAASSTALACLIMFVMQMTVLKKGDWVYAKLDGRSEVTFVQKSYFIFALLGFLICLGAGAYCLLWYLPSNWGGVDEDGEFTPIRVTVSGLAALFLGGALTSLVLETVKSRWMMQRRLEDIVHLEKHIKGSDDEIRCYQALIQKADDPQGLTFHMNQLRGKLDNLRAAEPEYKHEYGPQLNRELHFYQIQHYTVLLEIVADRLELCEHKDQMIELQRKFRG